MTSPVYRIEVSADDWSVAADAIIRRYRTSGVRSCDDVFDIGPPARIEIQTDTALLTYEGSLAYLACSLARWTLRPGELHRIDSESVFQAPALQVAAGGLDVAIRLTDQHGIHEGAVSPDAFEALRAGILEEYRRGLQRTLPGGFGEAVLSVIPVPGAQRPS